MNRYYAELPFFKWLRTKFGIKKPVALRWGEWEKWDDELKKTKPLAFFLTETFPELLEKIPKNTIDHIDNLRIYVVNCIQGTHKLSSNLQRGKWHEFDTRLLNCLFDSFIDFIEVETANHTVWCETDKEKYSVPFIHKYRFLEWGQKFRCPEAAMDFLKWEMTLTHTDKDTNIEVPTHQAIAAKEKMELYTWWKVTRPARLEPWVASGFRQFWDEMDAKYGRNSDWLGLGGKTILTKEESEQYDSLSELAEKYEQQYDDEDESYMIRLIKLRKHLWT